MRQGTKQLAHPIPHDLHTNANQQERSEFHNDISSGRTQQEGQAICKSVAEINSGRYEGGTDRGGNNQQDASSRVCGSFAPRVMATEIEPGPTVKGSVSG